jgi:hypothetical protein
MIQNFDWAAINAESTFTKKDWVTNKLPTWIPLLESLRDCPLSILEIGSADGRSSLLYELPSECADNVHRPIPEGQRSHFR